MILYHLPLVLISRHGIPLQAAYYLIVGAARNVHSGWMPLLFRFLTDSFLSGRLTAYTDIVAVYIADKAALILYHLPLVPNISTRFRSGRHYLIVGAGSERAFRLDAVTVPVEAAGGSGTEVSILT